MSRRRAARVLVVAALCGPLAPAQGLSLPKKVPAPPPGATRGTRECVVGTLHDLARYGADLGCLRGDLALATLAQAPLERTWATAVAGAAREIGAFASTLDPERPEAMYLEAVALQLVPMGVARTGRDVADTLCGFAESTYEDACIAYYCGSSRVRGSSPELNQAGTRFQRVCGKSPRCLPKDLDLNRDTCEKRWREDQEQLSLEIRTRQSVFRDQFYSPPAVDAVKDWSLAQADYREKLRESVFAGRYEPLPVAAKAVESKAAVALMAVRSDEVKAREKELGEVKQAVAQLSAGGCPAGQSSACEVERARKVLQARQLEQSVSFEKRRVEAAARAGDAGSKLDLLAPEVAPPVRTTIRPGPAPIRNAL